MDFNRQNNQANSNMSSHGQPEPFVPARTGRSKKHSFKLNRNPVGWGLLLIALVLIAFGLLWYFRGGSDSSELTQVNKSEYQAVFLDNGQVYFGKLVTLNNDYAKITNIFYLQVNQTVQPNQDNSSSNSSSSQNQGTPSLVKLGNEIHGPEDAMMINRSQIAFWENLKPTGQVSEAIARYYQSGGDKSTQSTTTPSSSSTSTPTTSTPTSSTTTGNSTSTSSNSSSSTTNQ